MLLQQQQQQRCVTGEVIKASVCVCVCGVCLSGIPVQQVHVTEVHERRLQYSIMLYDIMTAELSTTRSSTHHMHARSLPYWVTEWFLWKAYLHVSAVVSYLVVLLQNRHKVTRK